MVGVAFTPNYSFFLLNQHFSHTSFILNLDLRTQGNQLLGVKFAPLKRESSFNWPGRGTCCNTRDKWQQSNRASGHPKTKTSENLPKKVSQAPNAGVTTHRARDLPQRPTQSWHYSCPLPDGTWKGTKWLSRILQLGQARAANSLWSLWIRSNEGCKKVVLKYL